MSWLSSALHSFGSSGAGAAIGFAVGGPVGAAIGAGIGTAVQGSMPGMLKPKMPPVVLPQVPSIDDEVVKAQLARAAQNVRRRVAGLGRGSTILTSSSGLSGAAPVFRKTLLGE